MYTMDIFEPVSPSLETLRNMSLEAVGAVSHEFQAAQTYWAGVFKYVNEFMLPYWPALNAFYATEKDKLLRYPPWESIRDYMELLQFNLQVAQKGLSSSQNAMLDYHVGKMTEVFLAWLDALSGRDGNVIAKQAERHARLLQSVVYAYPKAILDIKPEYGFHFDNGGYEKVAETERFLLYQIFPTDSRVKTKKTGKPVVVIPPYVLGANILAFLPGENKSYVHAFANQGIPTYIRIMKDIKTTPAVQVITGEDDAMDTKFFCEKVKKRHGRDITLNGYCQGGFVTVVDLLSGELDGLVDALICCVTPMDGTRSKSLVEYLQHLPPRFRDLGYAVKTLPNGNKVVNAKVQSWVYKLKSIEKEAPLFSFYRDLMMFDMQSSRRFKISKTAAAINYWLNYDMTDLPVPITKMSFDSYTIPVDKDGTLPFKLFGRKLNFKRLKEKGIQVLICYAEKDDLVDKEAVLAPLDFIDAEVTAFPKGHAAIATSWSHPDSKCALHTRFGDNYRGPVRYQLDLDKS